MTRRAVTWPEIERSGSGQLGCDDSERRIRDSGLGFDSRRLHQSPLASGSIASERHASTCDPGPEAAPPRADDEPGPQDRPRAAQPADDVIVQGLDRRSPGGGLPRHGARTSRVRQPALWKTCDVVHDGGTWGAFPRGRGESFLSWALRQLGARSSHDVLHVCSGGLGAGTPGVRVDIRAEASPSVVADGRALPFADAAFAAVLIDPPYTVEYARDLYGTDYPRPSHLLAEAARVVKPLGRIGILHFLVPNPPADCDVVAVHGVTQGCGYRIRALTIYQRRQRGLFEGARA